jgi:hypothetical protein
VIHDAHRRLEKIAPWKKAKMAPWFKGLPRHRKSKQLDSRKGLSPDQKRENAFLLPGGEGQDEGGRHSIFSGKTVKP